MGPGSAFLNGPMRFKDGDDSLFKRSSGNGVPLGSAIAKGVGQPTDVPRGKPEPGGTSWSKNEAEEMRKCEFAN